MKERPLYRRKPRPKAKRDRVGSVAGKDATRVCEEEATREHHALGLRSHLAPAAAKVLGAYYTDSGVAAFLSGWALRSSADTALDPSAGGGAFLAAAAARIAALAGNGASQIVGIDVDAGTCARVSDHFVSTIGWSPPLHCEDFFAVKAETLGRFDAVIGNPPFIRYQHFFGAARDRALGCAARQGVRLNRLASSWAPFVVHASGFVKTGGRLAMVLPQELLHAAYAAPVLRHLASAFRRVTLLTFREKLFPDLSENTLLVLAEEKAEQARGEVRVLDSQRSAEIFATSRGALWGEGETLGAETLRGERRAIEGLLPTATRDLYRALRTTSGIAPLGELADVGIGYVSGANDFFHPTAEVIARHEIPPHFLRPAVRRGRALLGAAFTEHDWEAAATRGDASLLMQIPAGLSATRLPPGLRTYLERGEVDGIADRYKCRVRKPWYSVPHVYRADAFLTYMSGARPMLSINETEAVATNTLHVLQLKSDVSATLPFAWLSALTSLSVEIEGHALGGGMLKLEPTEAERVLVPIGRRPQHAVPARAELDHDLRAGRMEEANALADEAILKPLGLSALDCRRLREGALLLRERRGIHAPRP